MASEPQPPRSKVRRRITRLADPMSDMTPTPTTSLPLPSTTSLDQFQTEEQRHVLDTVAQIRKCGLEGVLSLPQLVVCGDQSAGKSSVLEALTEIPFPRNDNLCTRFATEITLRRASLETLSVRIIPADTRPPDEQAKIKAFSETISDFTDLPAVMNLAMIMMGLDGGESDGVPPRAFARDVLSIEIEGPTRPQLTLVDVPGLIQTETKGVTKKDRKMVAEITNFYIQQPRTICLAVISATNDYANQPILTKVREVDPEGERTLGIITKPDRLDHGSGTESAFIELAQNKDIFFRLGWHVLKNREFKEMDFLIDERNTSERTYFQTSKFKILPPECVGIDALRTRLSLLLSDHVKHKLPSL
jgi:GTPase SAR1 family protein